MQRCKSRGHAQRFLSAYVFITQHFRPRRHRFVAPAYRQEMQKRFQSWREITSLGPGCLKDKQFVRPALTGPDDADIRANKLTMPF